MAYGDSSSSSSATGATGAGFTLSTNSEVTGAVTSVLVTGATDTSSNDQTFVDSVAGAIVGAGLSSSSSTTLVPSVSVPSADNAVAVDSDSINVVANGTTTAITNTGKGTTAVAVIGSGSDVTIAGGAVKGKVVAVVGTDSTVTASGKASIQFTDGTGTANILQGANTVDAGSANVTVTAAGSTQINLGSGSSNIDVSSGTNTILGGSGSSNIKFESGNNTYYGANNSDSVKAGSGQDSIYGGADNQAVYGKSGETITGSGSTYIQGGSGNTINLKGSDTLDGAWNGKIKDNGQWGGSDTVKSTGALGTGQLIDGTGNYGKDPNTSSAHGHLEIYVNGTASDTIIGGDNARYNNAAGTPQTNVGQNVQGADSTQAGTGANGVFILSAANEGAVNGKDSLFGGSAHDVVYVANSGDYSITANTGAGNQFTTITFANGQSLQLHNVDVVLDPTKHP